MRTTQGMLRREYQWENDLKEFIENEYVEINNIW